MSIREIGCCGAYCGTCRTHVEGQCAGCKRGYENGERDIRKARCAIKRCCMEKGHATCADCADYEACPTVGAFHNKNGYKYGKYKQAVAYIRAYGYDRFLKIADTWKNACGKYG